MKKSVYTVNHPYIFDPNHKGAPYSLNDGESWTNAGEWKEVRGERQVEQGHPC